MNHKFECLTISIIFKGCMYADICQTMKSNIPKNHQAKKIKFCY